MYIKSNKIDIFPLAKARIGSDGVINNSRLFYESNITNLIRQIVDRDSFIISIPDTFTNKQINNDIEFNIYGYYFKIYKGTDLSEAGNKKYLVATMELTTDKTLPTEILGQDDNGKYAGLDITSKDTIPTDTDNVKNLVLATYNSTNSNWVKYTDSCVKFIQDSVNLVIDGIDGKH